MASAASWPVRSVVTAAAGSTVQICLALTPSVGVELAASDSPSSLRAAASIVPTSSGPSVTRTSAAPFASASRTWDTGVSGPTTCTGLASSRRSSFEAALAPPPSSRTCQLEATIDQPTMRTRMRLKASGWRPSSTSGRRIHHHTTPPTTASPPQPATLRPSLRLPVTWTTSAASA